MVDLIGNTPLVRLRRISEVERIPSVLAMKMETTNPGGSSKDRPALEMILAAERDGLLQPGGTIVEPTSGNTGVGLAIVAAQRGYRCVFVMTDKVAPEKVSLLEAYGAEVVVCPVAVAPEDPQSYYSVAERLTDRARTRSGPTSTPTRATRWPTSRPPAPSCGRRPAGASPTSSPAPARAARSPASPATSRRRTPTSGSSPPTRRARCSPAGPAGRTSSRASARTSSRRRGTASCTTRSSRSATRRASSRPGGSSRVEGILIGGSGGMAVAAAIQVAKRAGPDDIVVVLNPDSGRGYLSRVFDDEWMANFGFLRECDECVGAVLDTRGDTPTSCCTSTPTRPCARPSS